MAQHHPVGKGESFLVDNPRKNIAGSKPRWGLFVLMVLILFRGYSQCPTEDVVLETQQQVDQFVSDYPDCTQLNFSLTVKGLDIMELSFLGNIKSINTSLTIHSTKASVLPLENLERIGGNLIITNNEYIPEIVMPKISSIGGGLEIAGHYQLKKISGFQNITSLEYFSISHNWFLESIPEFNDLQSITFDLHISENETLKKIVGFKALTCSGNIMLHGNDELEVIDAFPSVVQLTAEWGGLWIHSNSSLKTVSGFQSLERTNHITYSQSGGSGEPNSVPTFPSLRSAGYISLRQFTMPREYHGFKNLIKVGGISLDGLMNIENFAGFNKLQTAGFINVMENRDLISLSAFESLQETKYEFLIKRNRKLSNISNIHNLTKVGHDFGIFSIAIKNFDFIKNLKEVGDTYSRFDITDLPELEDCSGISNLIKYGYLLEPTDVSLDLQGCSTKAEIGAAADTDNDGILDVNDPDDDNDGMTDFEENAGNEFLDTDGDFLPDHVDTDSDNDGCADSEEGIAYFQQPALSSVITSHPISQTATAGEAASFSAETRNSDIFQWQVSKDEGLTWNDLNNDNFYRNVNTATLSITNAPLDFHHNLYRIKTGNSQNSCAAKLHSRFALLEVKSMLVGNPGENTTISLCPSSGKTDLLPLINGNPQSGGQWSPPLSSGSSVFDPEVDTAGNYTYSFRGNNCQVAKAEIAISFKDVPSAGMDSEITICKNAEPVDLFSKLDGEPFAGGSWSPALAGGNGIFDPQVDSGGSYTYTVNAAECSTTSAVMKVNLINEDLNAGNDVQLDFCKGQGVVDLSLHLSPDAHSSGTWSPSLEDNRFFDPAVDPPGEYIYTVAVEGCGKDEAVFQINIAEEPQPGLDTAVSICSDSTPFSLRDLLEGDPDAGGKWYPMLSSSTGIFDPSVDPPGEYTYSVENVSCGIKSAVIKIEFQLKPKAGKDAVLEICANDSPVDLLTLLGPEAESEGYWIPSLSGGNSIFDPAIDGGGIYKYRIATPICGAISSFIDITLNSVPNAGSSTSLSLCRGSIGFDLLDALGPDAEQGGSWIPLPRSGTSYFDPSIDLAGTYTYEVDNGTCGTATAAVTISLTAAEEIQDYVVHTSEFGQEPFIEVDVKESGEFEFSLDGVNYSREETFRNLSGGEYSIFVREINGCRLLETKVMILDSPKFFTPNGDGNNDLWKINGYNSEEYQIYIYDRYGKLLIVLTPKNNTWDGNYNGNPMPADDYWFRVTMADGKSYGNHFSLVR